MSDLLEIIARKMNRKVYKSKQMIVVRKDLKMRKGKIAAQAGHACVTAVLLALEKENRLGEIKSVGGNIVLTPSDRPSTPLSDWFNYGVAKICVSVDSEEELLEIDRKAKEAGLISALILDAGHTEFNGVPTYTCLALEPESSEKVDPITGDLPLY
ncbi:aminoacyl-tRNA hydrolase [Candidatus Methanomassiliicoccus intestinalis]|nr:aminoacyl-tRNA hydrolase [Candidatus Methanomassiliicoccus intestinalis]